MARLGRARPQRQITVKKAVPPPAAAAVSMVYKYPYGKAERMRLAR